MWISTWLARCSMAACRGVRHKFVGLTCLRLGFDGKDGGGAGWLYVSGRGVIP